MPARNAPRAPKNDEDCDQQNNKKGFVSILGGHMSDCEPDHAKPSKTKNPRPRVTPKPNSENEKRYRGDRVRYQDKTRLTRARSYCPVMNRASTYAARQFSAVSSYSSLSPCFGKRRSVPTIKTVSHPPATNSISSSSKRTWAGFVIIISPIYQNGSRHISFVFLDRLRRQSGQGKAVSTHPTNKSAPRAASRRYGKRDKRKSP